MLLGRLIWLSLAVALAVGSLQSVVQQWQAMPIILAAEAFEARGAGPATNDARAARPVDPHEHRPEAWRPDHGIERTAWTWVANVLLAFGLALLMLAVLALWTRSRGAPTHPRRAALWLAAAGFVSLYAWPALGLHADIPGIDAERLGSRQLWWLLAASCAGGACAAVALGRRWFRWVAAVGLLAVPFVFGPPQLAGDPFSTFGGDTAARLQELASRFAIASALAAATQWLALGWLCGWAFRQGLLQSTRVMDGVTSAVTP